MIAFAAATTTGTLSTLLVLKNAFFVFQVGEGSKKSQPHVYFIEFHSVSFLLLVACRLLHYIFLYLFLPSYLILEFARVYSKHAIETGMLKMEITGSSSSLNRDVASSKPALNGVHSNGVNTNGASKVNGNGAHAGSGKEDTDSVALANLLAVSVIVLRQAIDVLRAQLTTDDQLLFRSHYIPGSTIGK